MLPNLPIDFINQVKMLPFFNLDEYLKSFEDEIVSVRINPKKLVGHNINYEKVSWSGYGYYLNERPEFILDPLWHSGVYYVQEAGSMFIEEVLKQIGILNRDIIALDLAAAPGGKSTHLLSLMTDNSLLISNEILSKRADILEENLIRWGYDNFILTNNSSGDFHSFKNYFDLIILDAPCSGEGMFRKDRNSISEWTIDNVKMCVTRQEDILDNIKNLLKYNGYLIYSTCTFNLEENENVIEKFAKENNFELINIDISNYKDLKKNNYTIRAIPGKSESEGFSITILKNKNKNEFNNNRNKIKLNKVQNPLSQLVNIKENKHFYEFKNEIYGFNYVYENILLKAINELKVVTFGNKIANSKKSDKSQVFIPNHNLATGVNLQRNDIIELSDENVLKYLKGESLNLENANNGYAFVTFNKIPIGMVKVVNGRANNLYPDNFRIKKSVNYNEPIKSVF